MSMLRRKKWGVKPKVGSESLSYLISYHDSYMLEFDHDVTDGDSAPLSE